MTTTVGVVPSVRLFGGCRVSVDGAEAEIGGRKPRAILARLAWECGRVVPTDTLIADVWGDDVPASVRASLQMHVTTLRRSLAAAGAVDTLVTRAPGYFLALPRSSVDVLRFAELARQVLDAEPAPPVAVAIEALRLWDAPPFVGLEEVPFVERAGRWCTRRRSDLIVAAAATVRTSRTAASLLPLVEPVADEHPLDVPLNAARASLLHQSGRTRDALASIARLRTTLWEETGVGAGPGITELERSLLEQSAADEPAMRAPSGR